MLISIAFLLIFKISAEMWNLLKIFSWKKHLNILNLISYFLHLSLHISFYHISIVKEGPLKKKLNCPNYNSTVDTFD